MGCCDGMFDCSKLGVVQFCSSVRGLKVPPDSVTFYTCNEVMVMVQSEESWGVDLI